MARHDLESTGHTYVDKNRKYSRRAMDIHVHVHV